VDGRKQQKNRAAFEAGEVVAPRLEFQSFWQHPENTLWQSARYRTHLRVEPEDGVVRKVRPWIETDLTAKPLPCLGLAVAAAYLNVPLQPPDDDDETDAPNFLRLGQRRIPLDKQG